MTGDFSAVQSSHGFYLWRAQVLTGREEKMKQLEEQLGEDGLGVSDQASHRLRDPAP